MSLAKKISDDVKSALKGGDKKKLSIARYVYSELKNFLIKENLDRDVLKLSDENIIKIVKQNSFFINNIFFIKFVSFFLIVIK